MRRDKDHRVVAGASAERAGPWIQDTVLAAFGIAPLPSLVGIMLDEKVPAHRRVFRRERMKYRHLIGFR